MCRSYVMTSFSALTRHIVLNRPTSTITETILVSLVHFSTAAAVALVVIDLESDEMTANVG